MNKEKGEKGEPMGVAEGLSACHLPTAPTGQAGAQAGMGRLVRGVIASYEARVSSVEQVINATHEMLETFRRQREATRAQLRETLARAASLRRRDFDAMMQGLLARQEQREGAVRETMREYLAEQRKLAAALREALAGAEGIGAVKGLLGKMAAGREAREREVKGLLAEYRREHEEMARALERLLSNGGSVRVKELKATLRAIQAGRGDGGRDDRDQMRVLQGEGIRPF